MTSSSNVDVLTPTLNDVLFSSNISHDDHLGNIKFQRIIANLKLEYELCDPLEKPQVACKIIDDWRRQDPPGRFLSLDSRSGLWYDIGNKKARKQTTKFLRMKDSSRQITNNHSLSRNAADVLSDNAVTQLGGLHSNSDIDKSSHNDIIRIPSIHDQGPSLDANHSDSHKDIDLEKDDYMVLDHNSDKLFGREDEISILEEALRRAKTDQSQVLLIQGSSGTGKTTLARFLQRKSHCNVLQGTFINGQQHLSHSVFGYAFSLFLRELDCDEKSFIKAGIEQMTNSSVIMRSDLVSILEIIPEFRSLVNDNILAQTEFPTSNHGVKRFSSGPIEKAVCSRYKYVLGSLLSLLSSSRSGKPLVFFMDDIQWASESDIDVLLSVTNEIKAPGILFLFTLRNDNLPERKSTNSALMNFLASVQDKSIEITLKDLTEHQLLGFLAQTFQSSDDSLNNFAKTLWPVTNGNFVVISECLRSLQREGIIRYLNGTWCWNIDEVRSYMTKYPDGNFFFTQITLLPEESLECLRNAACIGTVIDEQVIQHLMIDRSIDSSFGLAFQRNWMVMSTSNKSVSFSHDLIREVIYESIPIDIRSFSHYLIGKKLWRAFEMEDLISFIFIVVDQLILGQSYVQDRKERVAVAKLCLAAGEQAVRTSGLKVSGHYFSHGINFLDPHTWREEYHLCLSLYSSAAECSHSNGDVTIVENLFKKVIENTINVDDTARVRIIYLSAMMNMNKLSASGATRSSFLKLFGEKFPSSTSALHLIVELVRLRWRLWGLTNEHILKLPVMKEFRVLTVMQMLNVSILHAGFTSPELLALIGIRMMNLSLSHGVSSLSGTGFVIYASILCGFGSIDEGHRFARLGYAIQNMFGNDHLIARFHGLYQIVVHWKNPCHKSFMPLLAAYRIGSETGDIEFAMYCGLCAFAAVLDREPLSEINSGMQMLSDRMVRLNQQGVLMMCNPFRQLIHNLLGQASEHPSKLNGQIFHESQLPKMLSISRALYLLCYLPILMARYFFGDDRHSEPELTEATRSIKPNEFPPLFCSWVFLLNGLRCIAHSRAKNLRRASYAKKLSKQLRQWANHEPHNFLWKHLILDAELQALTEQDSNAAFPKYIIAIAMSKQNGSVLENALSNELTAKYLLRQHRMEMSEMYYKEAIQSYNKWGATAKSQHLYDEMQHYWN